jgi:anaerobic selenocysteine-containing dehydrogenase
MRSITSRWRRAAFVAAMAGALGFGATQALASPAPPESRGVCGECWGRCPLYGGDRVGHQCICCLP